MSDLLTRAEAASEQLLPALFDEMNRTGHAGHCILVSRVIKLVFDELGIRSEPLCVDYWFANAAAVRQMDEGRDLEPPATLAMTGSGTYHGYDHHVVTLVADDTMALLLDPTIIQIVHHMPEVDMPSIKVTLPWPWEKTLELEVGGGLLRYSFRPDDSDFMDNDQWTDVDDARSRASAVLRRMRA